MVLVRKIRSARIHFQRWREANALYRRVHTVQQGLALRQADKNLSGRPVLFFNASTRIGRLSLNAAFNLLTSWSLQYAGVPVRYFCCEAGMLQCQLGAKIGSESVESPVDPPCKSCRNLSRRLFPAGQTIPFSWNPELEQLVPRSASLPDLIAFQYADLPLGELVLPTLRWCLRRHNLEDNHQHRELMRKFVLSAINVAQNFSEYLLHETPRAVVVFNGISFPEAVVREIAMGKGIKVITHEVGLRPLTGFFSTGHATENRIAIPDTFQLDADQNAWLDAYLTKRFKGDFSMADVEYWPEIRDPDSVILEKIQAHKNLVTVFTNVIFDTSQMHANVLFEDLFDWLDTVFDVIEKNPDTLFIIRAHPDELRVGKDSKETVQEKVLARFTDSVENIIFIAPDEYVNSYELVQRSKFIMVYNSSIGLEGSLLRVPVLCAGQARYTHYPTVFFPNTRHEYQQRLTEFLTDAEIELPQIFYDEARRFLFYHLNFASLDFSRFIEQQSSDRGQVLLKEFSIADLDPINSPEMKILQNGILADGRLLFSERTVLPEP